MLASHHAIIVKSYVIVHLSYDYLSTGIWCRTIHLWFSFSPGNHSKVVLSYDYRTTIVRLSYDYRTTIVRLSCDYRTTIVRLSYDYRTTIVRISYDYRTTIVRLSYDYRTTIVRLSYDYRTTIVRLLYNSVCFINDLKDPLYPVWPQN